MYGPEEFLIDFNEKYKVTQKTATQFYILAKFFQMFPITIPNIRNLLKSLITF